MKLIRYTYPGAGIPSFDALFSDSVRRVSPILRAAQMSVNASARTTPVEWFENEDHFFARVDLPGVKRENLRLDYEEGLIRLGIGPVEANEAATVSRTAAPEQILRCPEGIQAAGIEAKLADGVLELSLPKAPESKPFSINIQ
jgi:HSP20 family protein